MASRSYPAEPVYQAAGRRMNSQLPAVRFTLLDMDKDSLSASLVIERVAAPTPDARMLITELEAELSAIYSAEQRHGLSIERVFQPNVLFFIAYQAGQPVGCGGIALGDGWAEVKRMYVRPQMRGRGVAQAILAHLEQEARSRGVNLLVLETGDAQQSAIRLYEKAGFRRCGAFGEYAAMPQDAIKRSVFLEKRID